VYGIVVQRVYDIEIVKWTIKWRSIQKWQIGIFQSLLVGSSIRSIGMEYDEHRLENLQTRADAYTEIEINS
jgi:hypothetical protein